MSTTRRKRRQRWKKRKKAAARERRRLVALTRVMLAGAEVRRGVGDVWGCVVTITVRPGTNLRDPDSLIEFRDEDTVLNRPTMRYLNRPTMRYAKVGTVLAVRGWFGYRPSEEVAAAILRDLGAGEE